MAERGLGHGSLGHSIYDPSTSDWSFERSTTDSVVFHAIEPPQIVHQNANETDFSAPEEPRKAPLSTRFAAQTKALIASHPELQAAADFVAPLARVSEAITQAARHRDTFRSRLLALGSVSNEVTKQPAQVVAYVSGPSGSDLHMSQINTQRQGWNDAARTTLKVPKVSAESTVWRGPGAPIQGVICSHAAGRGNSCVAARLPTKTIVFQAALKKVTSHTPPRLELSIAWELGCLQTSHIAHADVAFDPWSYGRVAFVDPDGGWSVWEAPDAKHRLPRRMCHDSLDDGLASTEVPRTLDGWARVTWVLDTTLIAVCNRYLLQVFEISKGRSSLSQSIDVGLKQDHGWILDMAVMQAAPRFLLVLTSTHITLLRIDRPANANVAVQTCISVQHYRNGEDTTMRMRLSDTANRRSGYSHFACA